ncbi:peptidoglycan editing factor PgeF [Ideonella sp.]|uniref:peptidoglycan editing factor PgeF n=1 Tax=Ideonella sp. TaxID=1929293 RepID=UPI003BB66E5E
MQSDFSADWLRPTGLPVQAGGLMSTRLGGVSLGPWASMNLRPARLVGGERDEAAAIQQNQARFASQLEGAQPVWLDQVHGHRVVQLDAASPLQYRAEDVALMQADASVTDVPGVACVVLVADCLPVLMAAPGARAVGAAHAGWRGLASGVLEATLDRVCQLGRCEPGEVAVWMGACIGPDRFEVGADVLQAFAGSPQSCFKATDSQGVASKWWADLPELARWRLRQAGVLNLSGGSWCTASDPSRFFSFRRDGVTGRHAAAIWIRPLA